VETVFIVGVISGAGLMAAVIFATEFWYARRHPITRERA
jgi:hypothetical protein